MAADKPWKKFLKTAVRACFFAGFAVLLAGVLWVSRLIASWSGNL